MYVARNNHRIFAASVIGRPHNSKCDHIHEQFDLVNPPETLVACKKKENCRTRVHNFNSVHTKNNNRSQDPRINW